MPERLHQKFDKEGRISAPKNGRGNLVSQKSSGLSSTNDQETSKLSGTSQSNGVKRFRDGSPKATPPAIPQQNIIDSKAGKLKIRKQENSHDINGTYNSTHAAQSKSFLDKPNTSRKGINTASGHPHSSLHGGQNGQKLNFNGLSKAPHQKPTSQALKKIAADLEKVRKTLPIWSKKADIRWALRNNDVMLLVGETGSGKSTQVPHFIYTEPWCKKKTVKIGNKEGKEEDITVGGMIAITQPRRVAAITLAHRVAREVGSSLGSGNEPGKVGYSVRFDSKIPTGTKIKFLTEGTLLQEMLRDPNLRQYSAVIVDEIHERSVDVDLIAGFLRQMVHGDKKGRGGIPLKVIIMSATLDLGGLEAFFAKPETQPRYQPGSNHGVILAPHLLEDMVDGGSGLETHPEDESRRSSIETFSSWEGFSSSDDEQRERRHGKKLLTNGSGSSRTSTGDARSGIPDGDIAENGVKVEYVQGRQHEVDIIYEVNPSQDYMHTMLQTILLIHTKEPLPGDILAFLTGQEEIEALQTQLEHYATQLVKTIPRMKVMPLYGSLPAQAQQAAFEKVKNFTRKIVLATNIAETSVTVSGVRYVVDCGKAKVKQYRPRLGMESLLVKPISRVSAIQRAGRAGREAPGKCYRIYAEKDFMKLEQDELPEILRSDVIEAVLKMKARGVDDVLAFPLMDSPDPVAMEKALLQLHIMGALDARGNLTDTGKMMAAYPLPAAYGRVLIAAADPEADCLLEAIDVIACLTSDAEIYLQAKSDEEREEIEEYRKDLQRREGDILTYLTTMQRYAAENANRIDWCRKRIISTRAMKMAMDIRKQLRTVCIGQKLLKDMPPPDPVPFEPTPPERAEVLLKAFMKAFATKTAVLAPDGTYLTTQGRNPIAIHPSSILHGQKKEAIMFLDHVFTAKNYAKRVSAIQANWIVEALDM